jgi:hypothetical protein
MAVKITFFVLSIFVSYVLSRSIRLEHCTSQELDEIHQNHTTCFLERLKKDPEVVAKIKQNYNDDLTIKVDFKKVCSGKFFCESLSLNKYIKTS